MLLDAEGVCTFIESFGQGFDKIPLFEGDHLIQMCYHYTQKEPLMG